MTLGRPDAASDPDGALADEVLASWQETVMANSSGSDPDRDERDFGDSAGYGGGGSTQDYRDVVGEDQDDDPRPNPLDQVMRTPADRSRDANVVGAMLVGLAAVALPLGLYLWRRTQPQRERDRRAQMGRTRENLARMQV